MKRLIEDAARKRKNKDLFVMNIHKLQPPGAVFYTITCMTGSLRPNKSDASGA